MGRPLRLIAATLAALAGLTGAAQAATPGLVISQVYVRAGVAPTYRAGYVELFNASGAAESLAHKTLQYHPAGHPGWTALMVLPAITVPTGGYVLLQIGSNGPTGAPLPPTDGATGASIQSSGTLALVAAEATIGCQLASCGGVPQIEDLVGYGTATDFEGTGPAPALSAGTTADLRGGSGCTDTDDNTADFAAGTPAPRSTSTAAAPCGGIPTLFPETLLLSRAGLDGAGGDAASGPAGAAAGADNRFSVFVTHAANLRPGNDAAPADVLLHDLDTDANDVVSLPDGPLPDAGPFANGTASDAAVSADGNRVAFVDNAQNILSAHNLGSPALPTRDRVWVRDRTAQTTVLASAQAGASGGDASADGDAESYAPAISADGNHVVFASAADNLVGGEDNPNRTDVFERDLQTNDTLLVSQNSDDHSDNPAVSADGRYVAYETLATNQSSCGTPGLGFPSVVVADMQTFVSQGVHLISPVAVSDSGVCADDESYDASISADGKRIAFLSPATNLAPTNPGHTAAYVHDMTTGATTLVSAPDGALRSAGPYANADVTSVAISPDGRTVAFTSTATNLGPDADSRADVFVRDIAHGTTRLVSVPDGPDPPGGTFSSGDATSVLGTSDGGNTTTFATQARNLVPGQAPATTSDVVTRTRVGSVPAAGAPPAITGTPAVNQTLTCSPGTWTGRPTGYQRDWLRDGTAIGATGRQYTVTDADQTHDLSCQVTAVNGAGASAPATSAAVNIGAAIPINQTPPVLTGIPKDGETLTCEPGTWTDADPGRTYRWVHVTPVGYDAINGATDTTYVVSAANGDMGAKIACEETASNSHGSAQALSNAKTGAPDVPVSTSPPTLTGRPVIGDALTCGTGTWDNLPLTYTRRWLRDGVPTGDTGEVHTVTFDDREHQVSCEVTAHNDVGDSVPAVSAAQFAVLNRPSLVTAPVLTLSSTGPRPTDKRASCSNGTWRDDPHDYSYRFVRPGGAVLATTQTYDVTADDLGLDIECIVTAHNFVGGADGVSAPVTVPLPPVTDAAGPTHMYRAGGFNVFDPENLMATSDGVQQHLDALQRQRVQSALDTFLAGCRARTDLAPGKPSEDPRTITDTAKRNTVLCELLLATPAAQIVVAADGVHLVADPNQCILGPDDPCAPQPVPMPPVSTALQPPGIDPGIVPERVLWDVNNDGRLDASCPGTAPVLRSIYRPGVYTVRAVLILPGSVESGLYPSTVLTFNHFAPAPPIGAYTYKPGSAGLASVFAHRRALRDAGSASGPVRAGQPFACRTSLDPPVHTPQPCVSEGVAGKVHVTGNLCPISLRSLPQQEIDAFQKSDPDVYALLQAQNDALGPDRRSARERAAPRAFADSLSAMDAGMQEFAAAVPHPIKVAAGVRSVLNRKDFSLKNAPSALDQILIAHGPVKVNGVAVDPADGRAVVLIPTDVNDAVNEVKSMLVSSSKSGVSLGGVPLSKSTTEPFQQSLDDTTAAATDFARVQLDSIVSSLRSKLNLGPFRLAGDADVKLVSGAAILTAQAELPALSTGGKPVRTGVTIKATPDGALQVLGIHLSVPSAYLGAVALRNLDLTYDQQGLNIRGQFLLVAGGTGIDIREFRIDGNGNFKALILDYLAGAGTGIPVGPGIFLTKLGGGLSLDPDELQADAAVSVGPSAGGGCPVVGADGTLLVHIGPAPFFLSSHTNLQIACFGLADVDFLARGDGYVSLGGSLGFDAGPLFFHAGLKGEVLLPNWQVVGSGEGGVRDVPIVGDISAHIKAILSNSGIAGCGGVHVPIVGNVEAGAGAHWNPALLTGPVGIASQLHLFTGCDLSGYETVHATRQAGGAQTIQVPAGERGVVFDIEGQGAAPRVRLTSPTGAVTDLSGDQTTLQTDSILAVRAEAEDRTYVLVGKPAAGTWTVTTAPGSVPVVRIQRASLLPRPLITAKVGGAGAQRILRYRVARVPGQVVTLVERGSNGGQALRTIKGGGHGTLHFVTARASSPQRQIVAQVQQDGLPRDNLVVARFSAPSPKVGRPRVRLHRHGRGAVVTWSRAFYAKRYDVTFDRADGSRGLLSPRGRRAVIPRVGRAALRVAVVGIGPNGERGRAGTASLRAVRKKHRKRH